MALTTPPFVHNVLQETSVSAFLLYHYLRELGMAFLTSTDSLTEFAHFFVRIEDAARTGDITEILNVLENVRTNWGYHYQ